MNHYLHLIILDTLLFIWYYFTIHYVESTETTKNISLTTLYIKYLFFMIPFYLYLLLSYTIK
jgi:hypothetical protein